MTEFSIEKRIENTVQHYVNRSGTFRDHSAEPQPLPDTSLLIQQLRAAGVEQARSGFAFSAESSEWVRSVSRLIYAALEDTRRQPSTTDIQQALMDAINCMDAFEQMQKTI